MESSPKRREIKNLEGNPGKIISRANQITSLGDQMVSSALALEAIADGSSSQKGKAFEKLREKVGECYEELKLAGERYQPTGDVLLTYGQYIATEKPLFQAIVRHCEDEWDNYLAARKARGELPAVITNPFIDPATALPDPKQDALDEADAVIDRAYEEWNRHARHFDEHYDDWEEAFDDAAKGIGKATKGGIEDSRWDNLDGFIGGTLKVLSWIGLGLTILAIALGSPFLAAIASILAIAALLLTIYSFCRGDSSGWALTFAIVGVIPFGSAGKLFRPNRLEFLNDMVGGLGMVKTRGPIIADMVAIRGGFTSAMAGHSGKFSKYLFGLDGGALGLIKHSDTTAESMLARLFIGKPMDKFFDPEIVTSADQAAHAVNITLGVWKTQYSRIKTMIGYLPDGEDK